MMIIQVLSTTLIDNIKLNGTCNRSGTASQSIRIVKYIKYKQIMADDIKNCWEKRLIIHLAAVTNKMATLNIGTSSHYMNMKEKEIYFYNFLPCKLI